MGDPHSSNEEEEEYDDAQILRLSGLPSASTQPSATPSPRKKSANVQNADRMSSTYESNSMGTAKSSFGTMGSSPSRHAVRGEQGTFSYGLRQAIQSTDISSMMNTSSIRQSSKGNMLSRAMEFARKRGHFGQAVQGQAHQGAQMFADRDAEKEQIHRDMGKKDYDVAMFYKETGCAQAVAKNGKFATLTLILITVNALWIGIEIEYNKESNLLDAEWYFQLGEYFFCAFFLFEWCVRFAAFRRKCDGLRDKWFSFDAFLVFIMVIETLILPSILKSPEEDVSDEEDEEGGGSQGGANISVLRMLRLLRLTRMVRFMRAMPELVTLVRSMSIACKPVLSTLGLLLLMIYMFAIIFKSQLTDLTEGSFIWKRFGRVTHSMVTLFFAGTLLDNVSRVANDLLKENKVVVPLFIVFILLSSFTLLNLLIGMLCEVVNVVAASEKEKAMVSYVKVKLIAVLEELDEDGSGMISKDEFDRLMEVPAAVQAITDLGVDLGNLMSLSDHLFEEEDSPGPPPEKEKVDRESRAQQSTPMPGRTSRMNVNQKYLRQSQRHAAGKVSRLSAARAPEPLLLDEDGLSTMDEGWQSGTGSMLPPALSKGQDDSDTSEEDDDGGKELSFGDFIEMVIRLRSENRPSVVDIIELRQLYLKCDRQTMHQLDIVAETNREVAKELDMLVLNHPFYKMLSLHPDFKKRVEADRKDGRRRQKDPSNRSRPLEPDVNALEKAISMAEQRGQETEVYDLDMMLSPPRFANGGEADLHLSSSNSSLPHPDDDALARAFATADGFEAPAGVESPAWRGAATSMFVARQRPVGVNEPTEFELPQPRPHLKQSPQATNEYDDFHTQAYFDGIEFRGEMDDDIPMEATLQLPGQDTETTDVDLYMAVGYAIAADAMQSTGDDGSPDETALGRALAMAEASDESQSRTPLLDSPARAGLRLSAETLPIEPDSDALQRALFVGSGDGWDTADGLEDHALGSSVSVQNTDSTSLTMGSGEPSASDVAWYRTGPGTPDSKALESIFQVAESAESSELAAEFSMDAAARSRSYRHL